MPLALKVIYTDQTCIFLKIQIHLIRTSNQMPWKRNQARARKIKNSDSLDTYFKSDAMET